MEPTFHDGDLVIMAKDKDFKEGSIVVASIPAEWSIEHGGDEMIKRVASQPGDRFDAGPSGVRRNGVRLDVDYPCSPKRYSHVVSDDEVFLRGDNVNNSFDSLHALCNGAKKTAFIRTSTILNSTDHFVKV